MRNEEIFLIGFLGAVGISAVAMIVLIWMRSAKGAPGWLMAAGTVPIFMGLATLVGLVFARIYGRFWAGEEFGAAIFGLLTIAAGGVRGCA